MFIKKYWRLLLLLLGGVVFILFLLTRGRVQPPVPSPSPTPQPFVLEHFFPPEGKQILGDPSVALAYSFSSPVGLSSAIITVKPYVALDLFLDKSGKTLYIKPLPRWNYNVEYQVSVEIKSKEGKALNSPVVHKFLFTPQTFSPLEEF